MASTTSLPSQTDFEYTRFDFISRLDKSFPSNTFSGADGKTAESLIQAQLQAEAAFGEVNKTTNPSTAETTDDLNVNPALHFSVEI